jgi:glycosyltransferase involved in cell wall biosynthesis
MAALKKVMWLIKGLNLGGAEQLLASSVPYLDRSRFSYEITYFMPELRYLASYFSDNRIPTFCLESSGEWDVRVIPRLVRLLRERKVDVLDCHLPYAGVIGRIAGQLAHIKPIIYTEHDLSVQRTMSRLHYLSYLANIVTFPLNDLIINVSRFTYQDVKRHNIWHTPLELVYNGIDLSKVMANHTDIAGIRQQMEIPASNKIVGHVANLRREKKQGDLLKAAKQVLEGFPQVTFIIVGRGAYESKLKKLARDLGIQNNVVFTGFVEDVYQVMEVFDIFVMSSSNEGFGISLAEAMALGKPAVVTRIGGMCEVVEDKVSGLLAEPRDIGDLADKMLTLLKDDKLRGKMGQAARQRVRQFDIRRRVAAYEGIYEKLLGIKHNTN